MTAAIRCGQVPNINSTSLLRFQAYSAVCYGAKGISEQGPLLQREHLGYD